MAEKLEIHDLKVSWFPQWVTIADKDVVSEYSGEVLLHKGDVSCTHGIIGRHETEAKYMPEKLRDALESFVEIAEKQNRA
jgi:hypothetical protein